MNYTESKQKLDEIRAKYVCAGDVIFRTAIQYVVEYGQSMLSDEAWQEHFMFDIDRRHNEAEKEGKILFCTRAFEKAILECAFELCDIDAGDFLLYIQREIYLGGDGVDYHNAVHLLEKCVEWIEETHASLSEAYDTLSYIGFGDSDINELGFQYILDVVYTVDEEE